MLAKLTRWKLKISRSRLMCSNDVRLLYAAAMAQPGGGERADVRKGGPPATTHRGKIRLGRHPEGVGAKYPAP